MRIVDKSNHLRFRKRPEKHSAASGFSRASQFHNPETGDI